MLQGHIYNHDQFDIEDLSLNRIHIKIGIKRLYLDIDRVRSTICDINCGKNRINTYTV